VGEDLLVNDPQEMRFKVRLFAVLRERAGTDSLDLRLPYGATVSDALRSLSTHDGLGELLAQLPVVMAVNREYANPLTELHRGDELALIPPLSGGSPETDGGEGERRLRGESPLDDTGWEPAASVHVGIREEPLSREHLRASVSHDSAGAIVVFEGVTRAVHHLEYESYATMAHELIERIMRECSLAHGLCAAAAEHRIGQVPLGEPSVIVAVSAPHRPAAFAAAREAIDRIKAEAPIWKREVTAAGESTWVTGTTSEGPPFASPTTVGVPREGATSPAGVAPRLTHLDAHGSARMVDVGAKPASERVARARARVRMSPASARAVQAGDGPKGEVLGVARIAGIQAAKQTAQLIPLAHPLPLSFVDVSAGIDVDAGLVELHGEARTVAPTGVEMEAMTACAVAALTVYDMVKGLERGIELEQVVLLEKRGGRSDYRRDER
jgi:molybdenum cofactor biosynthesis protein MoaC/molybdopterin converting factor subunit 1